MGAVALGLWIHSRIKKRREKKRDPSDPAQRSFQPSIHTDDGKWQRASRLPPSRPPPPVPHSRHPPPPFTSQPIYSERIIDIPHMGTSKEGDRRKRLHSVVSTLSSHDLPANPSSEALDHFRADRIGSLDDQNFFEGLRRPSMSVIGESQGRKRSGTSTLATLNDPSVTSFTIEKARRTSSSVRKISVGGTEDVMPYISGATSHIEPSSPTDLDERFAKPIAVMARPPSRIDFTQPFGSPRRAGDHLVAAKNPLAPRSPLFQPGRASLLPYAQGPTTTITPQESPTLQQPQIRERLPMIDVSPLISPKSLSPMTDHPDLRQNKVSNITTPSRSGSTKKKRRPDSIDLAHLRSPKNGAQLTTGHGQALKSSPPIPDASDGLKAGMASSVLGMKSAGGSTNFPYSVPGSASSGSRNEVPKTPRTATSEGCQSAVSDIESAQLFQAWKGFAPVHLEWPLPSIKRGLSVQGTKELPRAYRRAGTTDGDIDMEIVLHGDNTRPAKGDNSRPAKEEVDIRLSVSRPVVMLTPDTARQKDFSPVRPGHTKRASLTPSVASASSSTSTKSKITYLADVVKEEKRLSMLSVVST